MKIPFSSIISKYSYTTPPLLLDKSREEKEVHPLVATELANYERVGWFLANWKQLLEDPDITLA